MNLRKITSLTITEKIINGLGARQIKAEPGQTIKEIAEASGMEPQTLFEVIHEVVTSSTK